MSIDINVVCGALKDSESNLSVRGICQWLGLDPTSETLNEIRNACEEAIEASVLFAMDVPTNDSTTRFYWLV